MNERIKELANEAWQYANNKSRDGDDTHGWLYRDKFAELIVEECMWKIMQRKEEAIDNDWHVDEAMSAAISDISEHFGVEQ